MNCPKCGRENYDKTKECVWCGANLKNPFQTRQKPTISTPSSIPSPFSPNENATPKQRERLIAGLLGIFLGYLGVHNFYLGYRERGFTQLFLSIFGWFIVVGPFIAGIWGFIEGVQILSGQINQDADGQPLL